MAIHQPITSHVLSEIRKACIFSAVVAVVVSLLLVTGSSWTLAKVDSSRRAPEFLPQFILFEEKIVVSCPGMICDPETLYKTSPPIMPEDLKAPVDLINAPVPNLQLSFGEAETGNLVTDFCDDSDLWRAGCFW